jgi:integrase/recombinase XerD
MATVTWQEALRGFLIHDNASDFSEKTCAFHRTQLTAFIAWASSQGLSLDGVGKRHIDEYLNFRRLAGRAPKTRYHDASCVRTFIKWCVRNDLLDRNFMVDYEIQAPPRTPMYMPTTDDMTLLLKVALDFWDTSRNADVKHVGVSKRSFHRDRNFAILLMLLDTACCIGEVLSFQVEDYQPGAGQITVTKSKGRKARVLPVTPECAAAVCDWLRIRTRIMKQVPKGEDEGWLFISESGRRIDNSSFCKVLHRYCTRAGLSDRITLHSLRRFSINRLVKINPRAAQYIAGHEDMKTTELYAKIDAEHLREVQQQAGVLKSILTSKRAEKKKRLQL